MARGRVHILRLAHAVRISVAFVQGRNPDIAFAFFQFVKGTKLDDGGGPRYRVISESETPDLNCCSMLSMFSIVPTTAKLSPA